MPSFNLGLPAQVNDWWYSYGFSEAVRRVTIQQRGSDTNGAFNYYSAVIAALNAVGSQSVPAVPAFGAAATQDYCYGLSVIPPLVAVGKISGWAYGLASVPPLVALEHISNWAYGTAAIRLSAAGVMTG